MARIYKYEDYEYTDENEEFTTEDVKSQLQQYFPELANATAEEKALDNGDTEITFVKKAGTKGHLHKLEPDVPPMSDHELFTLEGEARCARNGGRALEMPADTVLSLICESWYLRSILGDPQPTVAGEADDADDAA
jgi:PRTRC genetic system protein C